MLKMKPIFGINSFVLSLLLINCWLAIIVPASSNHHHRSHHGDDHSKSHHRSSRIWGSLPAHRTRWKFMALLKIPELKKNTFNYCSSILINNRSLLTAAHCLEEYSAEKPIQVLFKTIYNNNDKGIVHRTRSFKVHEKYWLNLNDLLAKERYDIAIVKLEKPISLDPAKGIDQVALPIAPDGKQYPFDPNTCYLVAYGLEMPDYPDLRLQQVKVPVLPKELCKKGAADLELHICYGYVRRPSRRTIPKATMDGDSGGAFLCKTMHFHTGKHRKPLPRYVLIALNTAQVEGSRRKQDPYSMGIRITKYMDWIRQNS